MKPSSLQGERVRTYFNLHQHCLSVKRKGEGVIHQDAIALSDVSFPVSQAGRRKVILERCKNVHAYAMGDATERQPQQPLERTIKYNPYRYSHFIDSQNMEPVIHADYCEIDGQHIRCTIPMSPIQEVPVADIHLDPQRFQFKLAHNASGETGSLAGVQTWNPVLAGVILIWKHPRTGKIYAVDGHNRTAFAKRAGVETVWCHYLAVRTVEEARAMGALSNMASGRGTALDAAKFFRDSEMTAEELSVYGLPLSESVIADGLALSRLSPWLFQLVIDERFPMTWGVIVGSATDNPDIQKAIFKMLQNRQRTTQAAVKELVELTVSAPIRYASQETLFGSETYVVPLAIEKAELQAAIARRLKREANLFKTASTSTSVKMLSENGNVIIADANQTRADGARAALERFEREKLLVGPIADAINQAAIALHEGGDRKAIEDSLYSELIHANL